MKYSTSLSCLVQPPYQPPAIVIGDRRKVGIGLLIQYQVNLKLPRGSSKHLMGVSGHRSIQTDNQAMSSTILPITSPCATMSWASATSWSGSRPATTHMIFDSPSRLRVKLPRYALRVDCSHQPPTPAVNGQLGLDDVRGVIDAIGTSRE